MVPSACFGGFRSFRAVPCFSMHPFLLNFFSVTCLIVWGSSYFQVIGSSAIYDIVWILFNYWLYIWLCVIRSALIKEIEGKSFWFCRTIATLQHPWWRKSQVITVALYIRSSEFFSLFILRSLLFLESWSCFKTSQEVNAEWTNI